MKTQLINNEGKFEYKDTNKAIENSGQTEGLVLMRTEVLNWVLAHIEKTGKQSDKFTVTACAIDYKKESSGIKIKFTGVDVFNKMETDHFTVKNIGFTTWIEEQSAN